MHRVLGEAERVSLDRETAEFAVSVTAVARRRRAGRAKGSLSVSHAVTVLPHVRSLLGVWAHPDDEAYLSSALMARSVAPARASSWSPRRAARTAPTTPCSGHRSGSRNSASASSARASTSSGSPSTTGWTTDGELGRIRVEAGAQLVPFLDRLAPDTSSSPSAPRA